MGRRAQLALFAQILSKAPLSEEDPTEFLFHVRGVGGVGKSTLLRQEAARRADAATAVVDENDVKGYSRPRGTTAVPGPHTYRGQRLYLSERDEEALAEFDRPLTYDTRNALTGAAEEKPTVVRPPRAGCCRLHRCART